MASWGHRVFVATPEDVRAAWTIKCGQKVGGVRCGDDITHMCAYSYVTGRAGRTTESRKGRCERHARRFADRWNVDMPA